MKKILSFLVLMCVSLSAMASNTSVLNAEGVEIWYDFDSSTNTASVTYKGDSGKSYSNEYTGEVVIPSTVTYEGVEYSVTSIGNSAFYYCDALTSITLPESVTSIGDDAFEDCYSLTSITLPEGLTEIGVDAFYFCSCLISVTIPEGVTSIGKYAFCGCSSLTSITFPESLTSIGDNVFSDCSSLTSITLPESLTSIGYSAFYNCYKLYEVYNKSDLTITAGNGDNGFVAYYAKNVYTDSEGESKLKTVGDYIFYADGEDIELIAYTGSETSITLPSDYEGKNYNIGDYAFYGCDFLTSITLPESVTSIGDDAFYNCYRLYEVYNKSDLFIMAGTWNNSYVAYYAKNVYTDSEGESKLKTMGDYIFYVDGEEIELIAYTGSETSITLPSDYEGKNYNIGDYAFCDCNSLTSITLPEGVTSIGDDAFSDCNSLTSITLPEGVTSIGENAFSYCSSLTSITLPEGVTSIGDDAFYYCTALTSITIPEGVTSIGDDAFRSCSSLTSITIPEGVTSIGKYAFSNCTALTSITIPEGVTSIGNYAFRNCTALKSITLPEGVTSIGKEAFRNCTALKSITLPEGVTSIGKEAFRSCTALTSITIPEGVTEIGDYVFSGCNSLTSITLPESVTTIGKNAFSYCTALTSITLPEGLTSIGNYAFEHCEALTSITIPEGLTSIEDYAFYYCRSLTSITLPESLTSIGDHAFFFCSALTSITLPEGVTSIEKYAFYYCVALTSITSKNTTPPTIGGSNTFDDVDKSIPVYVPKSSVDAYKSAEYWKDFTNFIGGDYFVDVTAENGTVEGAGAYEENAEATLTATPAEGYKFVQWSDGVTDNPRTVVVVSDMTFTAEFELKEYTLTTEAENGTVEGAGTYKHGAEAKLTATPAEGYKFVQWSDGVTDNHRTVVVVSDTTLTADIQKCWTVYATAENGDISGVGVYLEGDEVTLTVTPAEGYKFVKWSDGVTDNPRTVVVVSDITLTADIQKCWTVYATAENGDISGVGVYLEGDEATLTVTPNEGYKFVQWSDGVTDNPRTVVIVSDTTFTAEFEIDDSPISDIQTSDVNVRLIGNNIVVEGADDYTVYSISGQNLGKVESVERGIYIVVVNGKSYKIVAK